MQAEFAADLAQVYQNRGSQEYLDPNEFYRRTYITTGLRELLAGAMQRMAGTGGDPVLELQTNFGGGKTHSMLALFHLFDADDPRSLVGVEGLMKEAGVGKLPKGNRAVLVGTALSAAEVNEKPDGTVTRTGRWRSCRRASDQLWRWQDPLPAGALSHGWQGADAGSAGT